MKQVPLCSMAPFDFIGTSYELFNYFMLSLTILQVDYIRMQRYTVCRPPYGSVINYDS